MKKNISRIPDRIETLISRYAQNHAEQVALIANDEKLTYGMLERLSDNLCQEIIRHRADLDRPIAVCLPPSPELFVSLLAVLKSNHIFMYLPPNNAALQRHYSTFSEPGLIIGEQTFLTEPCLDLPVISCDLARLGDSLPEMHSTYICPDAPDREAPAAILFTSGTTGSSKGVLYDHRGLLNLIQLAAGKPALTVLQLASPLFDAFWVESLSALLNGGTLILPDRDNLQPQYIFNLIRHYHVNFMVIVTSFLRAFPVRPDWVEPGLTIYCVGESCSPELAKQWSKLCRFYHAYGVTEAGIHTHHYRVDATTPLHGSVPVGKSVENITCYLLNENMQPCGVDEVGEIYIGGDCIALGYYRQPDLTAERFVADPFADSTNTLSGHRQRKMFQTGDLGRYDQDGNLVIVGRRDEQIKIRGIRINCDLLEQQLIDMPGVENAAIVPLNNKTDIAAFISVQPDFIFEEAEQEYIDNWQQLADDLDYHQEYDDEFNIAGWHCSYRNQPMPDVEMQEQVHLAVERILRLKPRNVLDIGCGTGLLLFQIAPFCEGYWASDISGQAIDQICKRLSVPPWIENVTTLHQPAHDFSIFDSQAFDTIILNSTVQYFPNIGYLTRLLERLCESVGQGQIFIGDVKHHQLQSAFQFEQMKRCDSYHEMTVSQVFEEIERNRRQSSELSIAPEYFHWLGRMIDSVNHVQVMPKAGNYDNELNHFRYDVVLHIQAQVKQAKQMKYLQWGKDIVSLKQLEACLKHYPEQNVCLTNVPDKRKSGTFALWSYLRRWTGRETETLAEAIASFEAIYTENTIPVEPAALIHMGEKLGYVAELNCLGCSDDHQFDIVFWQPSDWGCQLDFSASQLPARQDLSIPVGSVDLFSDRFANTPYMTTRDSLLVRQATARIAELFQGQWIPLQWVKIIGQLPLGHTGKTDRRELEKKARMVTENNSGYVRQLSDGQVYVPQETVSPESHSGTSLLVNSGEAASDSVRQVVIGIWREVLGEEALHFDESFFALGGHSLKAVQIITRLNQIYQSDLKVVDLLQNPTLQALVRIVERQQRHGHTLFSETPPLFTTATDRLLSGVSDQVITSDELADGAKPKVSYTQRRYWFLEQLAPESSVYNLPLQIRIRGALDIDCLKYALEAIGQRHQALNTRILVDDDNDLIQLTDGPVFGESLEYQNINHLDHQSQASLIDDAVERFIREPFDLSVGPLHRSMLIQISETEHLLLITLHHIIADGWSLNILLREFRHFYQARMNGETYLLAAPKNQYISYSIWQNLWLENDEAKQQKRYWLHKLNEINPFELPTDYPRPIPNRHRGKTLFTLLDSQTLTALKTLAAQQDCTLFMVLMAVFKILLWRHADQDDLSVGTPVANRHRLSDEQIIGSFANTLVIRSQLNESLTFEQVLEQVRTNLLEAYLYQDYPFEKLVEDIQPERDLGRSPVIQVWFSYFNTDLDKVLIGDMELEELETGISGAKFDLSLSLTESGDTLKCAWEYNTDLYCHETIQRLSERWNVLIHGILSSQTFAIGDYTLQSTETKQIEGLLMQEDAVVGDNHISDDSIPFSLLQCFDKWASVSSSRICLVDDTHRLTYGEVAQQVNNIASVLIHLGIGPGMQVAVLLPEKLETSIAILSIFQVGACVVPISCDYPRERIQYILEDAGIDLLIHHQETAPEIVERISSHVLFSTLQSNRSDLPVAAEVLRSTPPSSATAYILYTSGTEGWPKGVEVAHQSVSVLSQALAEKLSFTDQCKMLSCSSVGFDIFMLELMMPLSAGGMVYLVSSRQTKDPGRLINIVDAEHLSHIQATPSLYRMLVSQDWVPKRTLTLLCGGEMLTERLAEALLRGGARLYNMYGPTETTIWSTFAEICNPHDITIGEPVPGTNCYVLDRQQRPLCSGIVGELYIGGMGVAKGYINQPSQSVEKFLPDPFSRQAGARMYRTGDLARVNANGKLYLLGRKDAQIKLYGHRIELPDIERNIERCHSVAQACVLFLPEMHKDSGRVIAFFTAEKNEHVNTALLRKDLAHYLPAYMLPNPIFQLETMPRTVHGKIDKKALLSDYLAFCQRSVGRSGNISGKTWLQSCISTIWAEALGNIEACEIRPDDNFFSDLGGNSLMVPQIMSIIRFGFHMSLPLRTLFESPVLKDFCVCIERAREAEPIIISPAENGCDKQIGLHMGLSVRQQCIMKHISHPDIPAAYYNRALSYEILVDPKADRDDLDLTTLYRRMGHVISQCEIFRYRLVKNGGEEFEWSYADDTEPEIVCQQIQASQPGDERIIQILQQHREKAFDLHRQALIRVLLLQLTNEDHVTNRYVIQIVGHGLVCDSRTLELVIQQLVDGEGPQQVTEPVAVQYRRFVEWMEEWLSGPVARQQNRLFVQLAGNSGSLADKYHGDNAPDYNFVYRPCVHSRVLQLAPACQRKIRQLADSAGCLRQIIYLSAYFKLLQKYADVLPGKLSQDETQTGLILQNNSVTVGWLSDHRDWAGAESIAGPLENLLLVQAEFAQYVTDQKLVSLISEAFHRAYFLRDVGSRNLFARQPGEAQMLYAASFSSYLLDPRVYGITTSELEAGLHLRCCRTEGGEEQLELRLNRQAFLSENLPLPALDLLMNDFESILERLEFDVY
ncbi:non-ribosomal peptide synthetase [Vibrio vulnificus]|uniref:non-ribosomal peptide synthetase n=1 Tax=Vibrio vulnificus TaxID=672 RepID=UPI0010290AD6|nr:non-ribosomal peptide synthetase [Vibrio vulnificus]